MKDIVSVVFRTYDDGETLAILFDNRNTDGNILTFGLKSGYFYADLSVVMKYTKPSSPKQYKAVFEALREEYDRIKVYKRMRTQIASRQHQSSPGKRRGGWESVRVAAFSSCKVLSGVFSSMNQAAKFIGVRPSTVRFACIGTTVSCQGWYFRFVDEAISIDEIGNLHLDEFDRRNGEKRLSYPVYGMRKKRVTSKN